MEIANTCKLPTSDPNLMAAKRAVRIVTNLELVATIRFNRPVHVSIELAANISQGRWHPNHPKKPRPSSGFGFLFNFDPEN